MKPSKIYKITIPANGVYRLLVAGDYFKILTATGNVAVTGNGINLDPLSAGQGMEKVEFQWLLFEDRSGSANNLAIFIGDENFIDGLLGSVAITSTVVPQSSVFASAAVTVTNASTVIDAANPLRQYLAIQNNHATASIFVNLSGAAATVANGLKIIPGGSLELSNVVPTGAITAIGDIASNMACVLVEG